MNAGPKTACGGKRPQAGVFAVAVFRPLPLWSAGILPTLVMAGGTPALRCSRTSGLVGRYEHPWLVPQE